MDKRTIALGLEPESGTIAATRRAVLTLIGDDAPIPFVRDALLLTSELVTNVLHHTSGGCEFAATFDGTAAPWLRVDVSDTSPTLASREQDPGGLGGCRLSLLERVASRWGISPTNAGKTVWFELDGP